MSKIELYQWCREGSEFFAHSIWVGLVAVAIYFLSIRTSHKIKPSQRVWWGIGLLVAIPFGAALFSIIKLPTLTVAESYWVRLPAATVYWVFSLGCVGIVIAALLLLVAIVKMKRVAQSGRQLSSTEEQMISEVVAKINLHVPIPVKVSRDIEGPLLCGIFRPSILIPESVIKEGNHQCLESILAHEVAHYRRKDIWINLVQTVVEFAYFFHLPARWMSREVRLEREKACDDLAVQMMDGRSFTYASGLLELEGRCANRSLALAFGNDSTSGRAARIAFGERQPDVLPYSKLLVGLSLTILLLLVLMVFSVVKISPFSTDIYDPAPIDHEHHPAWTIVPAELVTKALNAEANWADKKIDKREVPMLKSVTLIERDGVVYDLMKAEPRLFNDIPNAWLLQYSLDLLKRDLPRLDPDRDHFTVLEEYRAGTDPTDSESHPDSVGLLSFNGRFHESYFIRYAARTDASTVQMIRFPSKKYPGRKSFFMKVGDRSPQYRIRLSEMNSDLVVIEDLSKGITRSLKKQESADLRIHFAKFSVRSGESFDVKEGAAFYIPGDYAKKWHLKEVSESECKIQAANGELVTLRLR